MQFQWTELSDIDRLGKFVFYLFETFSPEMDNPLSIARFQAWKLKVIGREDDQRIHLSIDWSDQYLHPYMYRKFCHFYVFGHMDAML